MNDSNFEVALTCCFFCGEDDKIVMNTQLTPRYASHVKEMHRKVIDMDPCPKCKECMGKGVILITIDEGKSDPGWNKPPPGTEPKDNWMPNPYRTGGWFVVTDEAIRRIINEPAMADWAMKHRWMFIAHEAAEKLGLFTVKPLEVRT